MVNLKKVIFMAAAVIMLLAAGCGTVADQAPATPAPTVVSTPEPTPEPAPEPTLEPLSAGSEGEKVNAIQVRLAELGYFHAEPTAHYGSKTERAVRAFQKQNGLQADGIAGHYTQTLLFSDDAKANSLPLAGYLIGIDAGHQGKANSEK